MSEVPITEKVVGSLIVGIVILTPIIMAFILYVAHEIWVEYT